MVTAISASEFEVDSSPMKVVGIFGGTFDPIHNGHIQMALEAKHHLKLSEVRLLPCHYPPHRPRPNTTSQQRLSMLKLAVAGKEGLLVDDRELQRDGPSYTVDTLSELRDEMGADVSLVLLMGVDAYIHLMSWHRWQELLILSHIAVFLRPGFTLPSEGLLADLIRQSKRESVFQKPAGDVLVLQQQQIDVSATEIRQQLSIGKIPEQLSLDVQSYIVNNQLYEFREKVVNDN
jgi:nicotinate-nucleotide adenylyltransferase